MALLPTADFAGGADLLIWTYAERLSQEEARREMPVLMVILADLRFLFGMCFFSGFQVWQDLVGSCVESLIDVLSCFSTWELV